MVSGGLDGMATSAIFTGEIWKSGAVVVGFIDHIMTAGKNLDNGNRSVKKRG